MQKNWDPINIDEYPNATFEPKFWSADGLNCLELNKDCTSCNIAQVHKFAWANEFPKKCMMPIAVQKLLNRGIKIPIDLKKAPRAGYVYRKSSCARLEN